MNILMLFPMILPVAITTTALAYSAHPRRGIVLGVSLPLEIADGDGAQGALRRYRTVLGFAGLALISALIGLVVRGHANAAGVVDSVGIVALLIVAFALRAREAAALKPYRVQAPITRSAELNPESDLAAIGWGVAAFLPLAAAAVFLRMHWAEVPARWPRHWDAAGHVNGWGTRSIGSVATPLIMGAFVVVVCLVILLMQSFAPGTDTTMRRKFCAPLALLAWLMSLVFACLALAPVVHFGEGAMLGLIGAHLVGVLGAVIWAAVRSGFMQGTPGIQAATEVAAYDGTPDAFWHAGLIYFNPNDAAVLVPKRFGWGWTLNFARPLSWLFLGIVLVLGAASAVLPRLLK